MLKKIADMGLAAYLKMHGFEISSINKKNIEIEVRNESEENKLKELQMEYVNSDFCKFDCILMDLKRLPIVSKDFCSLDLQRVDSLGISSYLQLNRGNWILHSRTGRNCFLFKVPESSLESFREKQIAWNNSKLQDFNHEIMAIKVARKKEIY